MSVSFPPVDDEEPYVRTSTTDVERPVVTAHSPEVRDDVKVWIIVKYTNIHAA